MTCPQNRIVHALGAISFVALAVGAPVTPRAAAQANGDVNCDETVDITDAIYLLTWQFLGGPAPCPPGVPPDVAERLVELEDLVLELDVRIEGLLEDRAACNERLDELLPHDWLVIPVVGIRVSNDDGSRPANITPQQAALWVLRANEIYAQARVRLEFSPAPGSVDWREIRSSLINGITGVDQPDWEARKAAGNAVAAEHPGRLVVFFRHGPDPIPTGGGFSWTDYDFVVMPGFNHTGVCGHQNITLFAHEVGHYLGLAHTFAGTFPTPAAAEAELAAAGFDADVFDGDGLRDTRPDPFIVSVQCTPSEGVLLLGQPLTIGRYNLMSYYDSVERLLSPHQIAILRQAVVVRGALNIRDIVHPRALAIEGEALASSASGDGSYEAQRNMRAFHGKWTGDAQLWWGGVADGLLSCEYAIASAGLYRVYASFTHAPDFGVHEVTINDVPADRVVDLYSKIVRPGGPEELGVFWLRAGGNSVGFRAQGNNVRSTGYGLGLDYLLFQAVGQSY